MRNQFPSIGCFAFAVALAFVVGTGIWTGGAAHAAPGTRMVVDMVGRRVNIPANPQKIACMHGPSYEMVFALGGRKQIFMVREDHKTSYPPALMTNPDLKSYQAIGEMGPNRPLNAEEFIRRGADLVIYWNVPPDLKKFDDVGIPAAVVCWSGTPPRTQDEANMDKKVKIRLMAEILGGQALKRCAEWEKYFDEKLAFLNSRLAGIPIDRRPTVYIGNSWGTNILAAWGPLAAVSVQFATEQCGGKPLFVKGPGMFPEINKEQLLAWGPEVIVVDNHGNNPERVMNDLKTLPEWAALPAVKNGRIYRIPSGVFFLDKGTTYPIFLLWLAQKLHPESFKDVDMIQETKLYFNRFYDYELSTQDAERVLLGWLN